LVHHEVAGGQFIQHLGMGDAGQLAELNRQSFLDEFGDGLLDALAALHFGTGGAVQDADDAGGRELNSGRLRPVCQGGHVKRDAQLEDVDERPFVKMSAERGLDHHRSLAGNAANPARLATRPAGEPAERLFVDRSVPDHVPGVAGEVTGPGGGSGEDMDHPFAEQPQEGVFGAPQEEALAADHDQGLRPGAGFQESGRFHQACQQAAGHPRQHPATLPA